MDYMSAIQETRKGKGGTDYFRTGSHSAAGCCTHAKGFYLPLELGVFVLGFSKPVLDVREILCFASTVVPLLEECARGGYSEIFPSAAGHGRMMPGSGIAA
jgi:hypothetical protein